MKKRSEKFVEEYRTDAHAVLRVIDVLEKDAKDRA